MAFTPRISTGAVVTWNSGTIIKVRDVSVRVTADAKDVTGQDDAGYRDYLAGLPRIQWTISYVADEADAVHAALRADKRAGTARTLAFTEPGGQVQSFSGVITSLTRPAPLGEAIIGSFTVELADATTLSSAGL